MQKTFADVRKRLLHLPPGRGASINARAAEAQRSRALVELMQRPRTGAAKLYAARRDRYTDSRGERWVHATPATRHIINEWVRRLVT